MRKMPTTTIADTTINLLDGSPSPIIPPSIVTIQAVTIILSSNPLAFLGEKPYHICIRQFPVKVDSSRVTSPTKLVHRTMFYFIFDGASPSRGRHLLLRMRDLEHWHKR
jgi:hypothetical protein